MKVMYTCDDNYVWLMGISAISLFENNKDMEELVVFLLGENISKNNKEKLKKIADGYGRKIEVIDVPKFNIPHSLISARWPLSAFTRLFSGTILPESVDKILYLDCDTIVSGSIKELQNIQFGGNIAIGVKDCISATYKKNIGLDEESPYVNAGVILFDVDALRNVDIYSEIEKYMHKYEKLINYADQDILNGMFKGKIGELNPKFDVMTINLVHSYKEIQQLRRPTNFYKMEEMSVARANPTIIHYTTNMRIVRPWFSNTDHPLASEFRKYMDISPWKDRQLKKVVFSSTEARIIGIIQKLPKGLAYRILGLIHAELKPKYIKMRAGK